MYTPSDIAASLAAAARSIDNKATLEDTLAAIAQAAALNSRKVIGAGSGS